MLMSMHIIPLHWPHNSWRLPRTMYPQHRKVPQIF